MAAPQPATQDAKTTDLGALKIDRKTTRRRRRGGGGWLVWLVVLALLAGAVFVFWRPITGFVDRFRLPEVQLVQVRESHPAAMGSVSGTAANGHVVASRRAALSADTPGRIVELNVTEGMSVKRGDVVARLYADEYAAAVERAKAAVLTRQANLKRAQAGLGSIDAEVRQRQRNQEAAQALVAEAEANLALAKTRSRRARDLRKEGASSQAQVDDADAALASAAARLTSASATAKAAAANVQESQRRRQVAEAEIAVAKAEVTVAEADEKQATATLDKTIVRAPFDGIVVLKDAEVGEVVSPNSQGGSNARGSVCTMVDFASLEVQAEVPETSLAKVKIGSNASIFLDAWPDRLYRGRVDRIWPTANRQQATIEVRVKFLKRDQDLRPDMGVRIVFGSDAKPSQQTTSKGEPQILVPESSIVQVDGKPGAFLIERDIARFQAVQTGETRAGRTQIQTGLKPGQRIVLAPPPSLKSGGRVRVAKSK